MHGIEEKLVLYPKVATNEMLNSMTESIYTQINIAFAHRLYPIGDYYYMLWEHLKKEVHNHERN